MNNRQALAAIKKKVRLLHEANRLSAEIDKWFEAGTGITIRRSAATP